MTTHFKITKTSTFATEDFKTFFLLQNNEFVKMTDEMLAKKTSYKEKNGWGEIESTGNLNEDYKILCEKANKERKERNEKIQIEFDAKILEAKKLFDLDVIESSIENIRLVLMVLNSQNWGSWKLPKMTIGYSVNQYDCDGKTATTIKLDEPVEGEKLYSYGAPRGHLTKYTNL